MADRDRWIDRGVISFEQAERLEGDAPPDRPGGPRTIEVLGYFGAIALVIATIAWIAKVLIPDDPFALLSGDLNTMQGGLIALAGAIVVFGTGYQFADRTGAVRRAAGFALLLGYGLATLSFSLLLYDLDIDDFTPAVVVIPSVVVAVIGWQRLQSVPTQLALFAMSVSALQAILVLIQVEEPVETTDIAISAMLGGAPGSLSWISYLAFVALGLAWIWLARAGTFTPRNAGFAIGAIYAWVFTIALFGTDDGWLALTVVVVAAYIWAATQWGSSVLGAIGAFGTIAIILQVMTIVFEEGPELTDVILWYGVPGVLALGAVWAIIGRPAAVDASADETPMPDSPS